ncbi:D-alanyl-D-alanine carboxypeptidase family protein [Nonomuraea sp. NPDC049637]|uniref:D-alanyl-D-alanine carboxypeptidase family protein n=1 Tax=Nonomuraea sp. NPDC049637 TaxID=3154356 RepID=UPI003425EC20
MIPSGPARTAARLARPALVAALVVLGVTLASGVVVHQAATSPAVSAYEEAEGAVPDGATVFDDGVPAVAGLDADLLRALRRAAAAAAGDGVEFVVNSGRRSPAYQERLRLEAVARYGSAREAARWVASPDRSLHVSGDAVDLGAAAAGWLSAHGAAYGLCQIYRNEPWHYELRPKAVGRGCPRMYADPTRDPRLRR